MFLTEGLKAFKLEDVYFAFIALGVKEGLLGPVWAMSEAWAGDQQQSSGSQLREEAAVHLAEWPLCFSPSWILPLVCRSIYDWQTDVCRQRDKYV